MHRGPHRRRNEADTPVPHEPLKVLDALTLIGQIVLGS